MRTVTYYTIFWINHQYSSHAMLNSKREAIEYARTAGFEAGIYRNTVKDGVLTDKRLVAGWSPLRGTQNYEVALEPVSQLFNS